MLSKMLFSVSSLTITDHYCTCSHLFYIPKLLILWHLKCYVYVALHHSSVTSWVCAAWLACLDEWYWSSWTMSSVSPSAHDWYPSWRSKRSGQRYAPSWVSSLGSLLIIYLFSWSFYDICESHSGSN